MDGNTVRGNGIGKVDRFTVGNLVLRGCASRAVKRDFRPYIQPYVYTSPNENFEYGYPHSNAPYRAKPHRYEM